MSEMSEPFGFKPKTLEQSTGQAGGGQAEKIKSPTDLMTRLEVLYQTEKSGRSVDPEEKVRLIAQREKLAELVSSNKVVADLKIAARNALQAVDIEGDRRAAQQYMGIDDWEGPGLVMGRAVDEMRKTVTQGQTNADVIEIRRRWVDGVDRVWRIAWYEELLANNYVLNESDQRELEDLRLRQEYLGWGSRGDTTRTLISEAMQHRLEWTRRRRPRSLREAPPIQVQAPVAPDRSAAFGPGYGIRPDWRTAPQVPHDSSFFDERFLSEWGIPPTYYKSDGSFGWVPADMVIALNQLAKAGKIVDRYLADAFGTATSEMNPDNVELFEQGVNVLMVLRKRISGDIEVMAGGSGGEGSPIKGFDFKKAALAIKHSESMKQALAVCMALKGKDVAGLDAIRVARGGSVIQVIEDVKRKYSKVKAVEEVEETDKHGHASIKTKNIVVDVFTNSKEEWQAIVDNSMGEMKKELAQRTGISLGAIELAMTYAQTWGGSMGNFRWGQMRERFKLLESRGHLRDFTDRNTALYRGRVAPLSSVLKNYGVESFLDAIQTVHDEAMLEAWNYLGSLEATVLKPARLIFRGQMNMTYNKEERSRLVWAAKGTFDAQYRGSWKFDDDDVKRQLEILEKEQIDGPSISAKRAKPGNVGGVLKDLGNALALKGEYEKFKGKG